MVGASGAAFLTQTVVGSMLWSGSGRKLDSQA